VAAADQIFGLEARLAFSSSGYVGVVAVRAKQDVERAVPVASRALRLQYNLRVMLSAVLDAAACEDYGCGADEDFEVAPE
jgi:hypothetical protein